MKTPNNIHNLESLEREIQRLRLEAKNIESKVGEKVEYVQSNLGSFVASSFNCKSKKHAADNSNGSGEKNERVNNFFNKVADRFSDRAVDGIENLFNRIFPGRK